MPCGVCLPVAVTQDTRAGSYAEQPRFTWNSPQESPAWPPPWRDGHRMRIAKQRMRDKWNGPIDDRHAVS
jgi:hypothetical protein